MRPWLRRIGIAAGSLVALLLLIVAGVYGFTGAVVRHTNNVPTTTLQIPTDSTATERGRHLATAITKCAECHGPDLGGKMFVDDPAFGTLFATNLTRGAGGVGATYSDADFVRVLRHGVRPDGRPVVFMPSQAYTFLSDADIAALIAYIRSVPPVDREKVATRIGPLARVLYVTKKLELFPAAVIDHTAGPREVVAAGPTAEYGRYLLRISGCRGCHGQNLSGGAIPGTPPGTPLARNLTPAALGSWTYADFERALREGTRPDGTKLDPFMPFVYTAQMTDEEIQAVWAYLQTIPAVETDVR
jgi:mono/diheme cytochrome c family protein